MFIGARPRSIVTSRPRRWILLHYHRALFAGIVGIGDKACRERESRRSLAASPTYRPAQYLDRWALLRPSVQKLVPDQVVW